MFQNSECKRSTADGGPFYPNALEFRIQSESARLRKTKTFLHRRTVVLPSGSRWIPLRKLKGNLAGSLDSARADGFIGTANVLHEFIQVSYRKNWLLLLLPRS